MFFIVVIGFSTDNLTLEEGNEQQREVQVELVTSEHALESSVQNGQVDVTVKLTHTSPNATLGRLRKKYIYMYVKHFSYIYCLIYFNLLGLDFKINDDSVSTVSFSEVLWNLREPITLQAKNDNDPGEIESFVLEVTSVQLTNLETRMTIEAYPGNPLIVNITDDDSECCSIFLLF